eukprot:SAG11_NODE_2137_length_3766_cov_2.253613_2_plen_183_part_00
MCPAAAARSQRDFLSPGAVASRRLPELHGPRQPQPRRMAEGSRLAGRAPAPLAPQRSAARKAAVPPGVAPAPPPLDWAALARQVAGCAAYERLAREDARGQARELVREEAREGGRSWGWGTSTAVRGSAPQQVQAQHSAPGYVSAQDFKEGSVRRRLRPIEVKQGGKGWARSWVSFESRELT